MISIICCSKARWSLLAACLSRCPSMRLLHRTYEPCFNFLSCSFFVRISRRARGVEWIDDETVKWTDFERRCFRCSTSRKRTRKMMLQPSGDSRMSDVVMYGISRNLQVPGYRPPVAISHQHDTLLFFEYLPENKQGRNGFMVQAFLDALPQSSDARWCPRGLGAVRQRHPGPLPAQYETYPCGVPVGALHRQRRVSKVFPNAAVEPATGYWSLTLFEDAE